MIDRGSFVAILIKLAGSFVGLLLVVYGTLNLWLAKSSGLPPAATRSFCELLLCQPSSIDSPTSADNSAALPRAEAQAALLLDPASAYRWSDLADAEMNARNAEAAQFCVRQALASAPGNPAILFRTANFYLRMQDYPAALRHLITVLRNPELSPYYDRVFALYSQMDLPLDDLLNQGLPHSAGAASEFLRFWLNQNKLDEAQETFNWIRQNSLTSLQSAGSYSALLAKSGKWDEAMSSWRTETAKLDPDFGKNNWIYNGGFEITPVDCPFDWQLLPRDAVQAERDMEVAYKGNESLRIQFLGNPKSSSPIAYQTVLLSPGLWQIKAVMKTQALTADQGVVVRVLDAENSARLDTWTESVTHTQDWTKIGNTFQVGPDTHLARVEITLPSGGNTGPRLTGAAWLDAITLKPMPQAIVKTASR